MGLIEDNGGIGRWIGTFDFPLDDHCVNHVRIKPMEGCTSHLVELIDDCFDAEDLNRFELHRLTDRVDLDTLNYGSEEWDLGQGSIDMFIITAYPVIAWVKSIAEQRPELYVRLDYQREDEELFGRVLIHAGVTKEAHLTAFPGLNA